MSLEKRELRRQCLAARRRLPSEQMALKSLAICARVVRLAAFSRAQHIVAYAALADEVDPSAAVAFARRSAKATYFPHMRDQSLEFLEACPDTLRAGLHRLLEPSAGGALNDGSSVLFLIPGVVFDARGGRLGRGGGHYDSALASHPLGLRLGLAVELQLRPGVPRDDWDEPVDAVVTERRLLWSAARGRDAARSRIEETVQ